jgi:tRNA(Arg) A34 adenosine deaminase TadA
MIHPNKEIMEKAIALAKEKKAVASIIVKDGEIIAQGLTTVFIEKQPFRHAVK